MTIPGSSSSSLSLSLYLSIGSFISQLDNPIAFSNHTYDSRVKHPTYGEEHLLKTTDYDTRLLGFM
jgi:hypothetical protein